MKEKEKELQKAFVEKEEALQESQLTVARKLGEAEHKVATQQAGKYCFCYAVRRQNLQDL